MPASYFRFHKGLYFCYWLLLVVFSSCISSNQMLNHLRTESGYCDPPVIYSYDSISRPLADMSHSLDSSLLRKYSFRSLLVANASGVLAGLKELQTEPFRSPEYLNKNQQILVRLLLVSTEIASIAAELDCEGERARQIADFVQEKENRRVRALTVFSITVGAIAGIGNAAAHSHSVAESIAIVGGITGAGLGLSALFSSRRILFNHPRNLLADLWREEKNSSVYPPSIWHMLSEKYFSNSQVSAIAVNMKQRWIKFESLDDHNKKSERLQKLFFGPGGHYSADELLSRVRMLNQVQAAVKLMNQDLQGLIAEIAK
jgi:hypothetical protein